ncbi:MAG: CDP-alcohol phosphatidyltransferase family protein [Xanthobacteraceae bacterium]|nr:CDP-alcohol phosphatidyltransferase family protein [Xanthobacteraceae bacterium]MBV9238320.1 CDP-alcohol phosphatidyltransferase family protein [Xanthobacteraceae bacterium]
MSELQQSADKPSLGQRAGRFGIHILTASGAALAFLALLAAVDGAWPAMFLWLGIALIVDAIDGPLARRFQIASTLPRWSGDTLDLVVDFVTYVFVPAFAIANSGLLPKLLAPVAGVAIVVTGAIYFADRQMKMPGNYFRGFPAIWNTAAFYLLLLRPSPVWSTVAVAALTIATFLPFAFIHPLRVVRLRPLTIALLVLWGVLALITLARGMAPGPWITGALCAIAIYVVGLGALRR